MADQTLDTSGFTCPIPIMKARKALALLMPGKVLEVVATDPAAPKDFAAFCQATGHKLIESNIASSPYRFLIEKHR